MKYTDLHCDTLYELYKKNLSYQNDRLHLRSDFENIFDTHTQVFAIWTQNNLCPDDAWKQFHAILNHAKTAQIPQNIRSILAVEGGNLLGNDLSRLDTLYALGVRFLTLVWGGDSCLGGAHDTNEGLNAFGQSALFRCLELGIHPDVSHASDKMFWQVAEACNARNLPILATHSNARAVCNHSRNLNDEMFLEIVKSGGVAGISMAALHVKEDANATIEDVLRHIDHYFSLGGEDSVCLGCDFDGISRAPKGIENMYDLPRLADRLAASGYSDCQIHKIFHQNADNFLNGILGGR